MHLMARELDLSVLARSQIVPKLSKASGADGKGEHATASDSTPHFA